ncbi:hypothetical protein J7K43_06925 [Candidatus Calescamantes bacterium]|nr:hypothetical protein [Candidatus Calescamantes bacterium]
MTIKEIKVGKSLVYRVCFEGENEEDNEIMRKIENFADRSAKNTYKRSRMVNDEHRKNIVIGKMAEYAFSELTYKYTGIRMKPSFENRVDVFDFNISGLKIDIKSSSMTTKRRIYNLSQALSSFNFTVLADQSFKDVIIQVLYPSREEYFCFYFSVWQYVKNVIQANNRRRIKMNGGYGDYFLFPLTEGYPLLELFKMMRR